MHHKRKTKLAVGIVLLLLLLACLVVGLLQIKGKVAYVNAESADEIFVYSKTSDSECSVRLQDKTVVTAIIPATVKIDGQEYTVTSITANGFAKATNLQKVRLPNTLKSIGSSAFSGCQSLTSLTLNAVESIGANAFALTNLEYLIIPESVTTVAGSILRGCSTQVYVRAELPDGSVTPEGMWSTSWNTANKNQDVEYGSKFQPDIKYKEIKASDLTSSYTLYSDNDFVISYEVDEYQEFCEANTDQFDVLYIPATYNGKSVTGIANSAFYGNTVSKIVIGYSEDAITIGSYAFDSFEGDVILINRDVILEDANDWGTGTVTSEGVFANSNLSLIVLPDTITEIGPSMFMSCYNLTDIQFITPADIDKEAEMDMLNSLIMNNTVELPKTKLTTIGEYAFSDTINIKNIKIPNNVTTVNGNILSGWNNTEQNQKAYIGFEDANSLPDGWSSQWKDNCEEAVIVYASESGSGEIKSYNISYEFNINESDLINNNPSSISRIQTITLQDAECLGYTFNGWYDKGFYIGENKSNIGPGIDNDITLYGVFKENKYSISYNSNKPEEASSQVAGIVLNSTNINYTQTIKLNANDYTLAGWEFVKWNTEEDGSGTSYKDGESVSKLSAVDNDVVILFAQWEPRKYRVVYDKNRPEYASSFVEGNTEDSEHADEYQNLTKNGYTLLGWHFVEWNIRPDGRGIGYSDCESVIDVAKDGEKEVTLYAQWEPNTYYIEYVMNKPVSGATFSGNMSTMVLKYDEYYNLTKNNFSAISYSFNNWLSSDNEEYADQQRVYNLTAVDGEVITLNAQWSAKSLIDCYYAGAYQIAALSQLEELEVYGTNKWTFALMTSFNIEDDWSGISEFNGTLNGYNNVIKYKKSAVPYGKDYGFICVNNGTINDVTFKPTISNVLDKPNSNTSLKLFSVGGAVGVNYGKLKNVNVLNTIKNPYMDLKGNCAVDIYCYYSTGARIAGIVGANYSAIESCTNYASIGGGNDMAGIVCLNYEGAEIVGCTNYGDIYFNCSSVANSSIGGIASYVRDRGYVKNCCNYGIITWAARINVSQTILPAMGRLAGQVCESIDSVQNLANGSVKVVEEVARLLYWEQTTYVKDSEVGKIFAVPSSSSGSSSGCVASGTLVTLSNGTQLPVEDLNGNEYLLVWNLLTGTFDEAPILFIDSDAEQLYEVINLYFSDGTNVKVISEHAFWDFDLNEYVFLRNDAAKYIGHWFNKQVDEDGLMTWTKVQLIDVVIAEEYTKAWSPVTFGHLCYYVNGMLSMPGATEGFINIFDIDSETLKINEVAMQNDIETFGLFTYEEFAEIYPITEEIFNAFGGQYLKISMGKGLINMEQIGKLINHYAEFLS